jgi:glycosyltransferase involved in cell wall biosynthesis
VGTLVNFQSTPVTILVPVFNASKHINEGLMSILDMARDFDEILIIDDGSEDDSLKQLSEISRNFENINLIPRSHLGLVDTLNFGIRESANKFIARADIDDLYSPTRIQKQIELMASSPNLSAVFSDYRFFSDNARDLGTLPSAVHPQLVHLSLVNHQRTPHSSVMFNKDSVLEAGGYKPGDFPTEDLALWIRLAGFSRLSSLPDILLNYRINPSGITETSKELMRMKTASLQKLLLKDLRIESILSNLTNLLEAYTSLPLQEHRRSLVFRDLTTLIQLRGGSRIARLRDLAELRNFFDFAEITTSAITLAKNRRIRKKYRSM